MKKYIKGNRIINATDKAFRLLYQPEGFKLFKEDSNVNLTVDEIKKELDKLGIEYTTRETKSELLKKLEGD